MRLRWSALCLWVASAASVAVVAASCGGSSNSTVVGDDGGTDATASGSGGKANFAGSRASASDTRRPAGGGAVAGRDGNTVKRCKKKAVDVNARGRLFRSTVSRSRQLLGRISVRR